MQLAVMVPSGPLLVNVMSSFAHAQPSTAGTAGHARAAVQLLPAGDKTGDTEPVFCGGFQSPIAGGWQSKGVTSLGGGWTAKVSVNPSARASQAEISRGGIFKGRLDACTKNANIKIDGRIFTLTPTGTVSTADSRPAPAPVPGGWQSKGGRYLGAGWSASVDINASARTARADIARGGVVKGHVEAFGKNANIKPHPRGHGHLALRRLGTGRHRTRPGRRGGRSSGLSRLYRSPHRPHDRR
ncbi:hypothetical protein ACTVZO_00440 [Streptomyces sp. IBSNAI002]|uniref:hypothetical protein n=1 Tax=Streptomyces sp. IBSNAI002 TaxID=3457500 RepID=UPI003FCF6449